MGNLDTWLMVGMILMAILAFALAVLLSAVGLFNIITFGSLIIYLSFTLEYGFNIIWLAFWLILLFVCWVFKGKGNKHEKR